MSQAPALVSNRPEQYGLRCPKCGCAHWRVIYTRPRAGGRLVRRRECRNCGKAVITTERVNG